MAGLVVGGDALLVIAHDAGALLRAGDDAVDGLVQGPVVDEVGVGARGEQSGLVEDVGQVRAGEAGGALGHEVEVDVVGQGLALGVDLEDGGPPGHVRGLDADLPVEAAGAQEGRVQDVGAVGGGDEDDVGVGVEAVHLDEELVEGLLALVVPAAGAGTAVAADGVDLVDEDDGGGVLLGLVEQVAHARGADADEHLDELGCGHGEEGHARLAGDGLGQEGLTGSGRAVEEDALGDLGADGAELLRLGEELADLLELLDGLVLAGDVVEGDVGHLLGADFRLGAAEAHGAAAPAAHAAQHPPHEAAQQQGRHEQLDEGGPPAGGGHHGVEALLGGGGLHEAVDLLGLGVGVRELDLLAHRAGLDALLLGLDVGGGEVQLDALVAVDDGDRLDRVRLVPQERQAVGGVDGAVAEHRGENGPAEDDDQKEGHQPQERVAQGVAELAVALAAVVLTGLARLPRVLAAGLAPRIFHRAVGPFNILIPQTLADSTAKVPLRLLTFAPGVAGMIRRCGPTGGLLAPRTHPRAEDCSQGVSPQAYGAPRRRR